MKAQSKTRLYALTALACLAWLIQSIYEAVRKDQLFAWSNIVFSLCLIAVTAYTGYCAIVGWKAKPKTEDDDEAGPEASAEAAEPPAKILIGRNPRSGR